MSRGAKKRAAARKKKITRGECPHFRTSIVVDAMMDGSRVCRLCGMVVTPPPTLEDFG